MSPLRAHLLRTEGLVARHAERSAVAAVLGRARAGTGGALLVVGDAGIGKSALVRPADAGAGDVIVGRATPPPAPTFRPLVELALAAVGRGARLDDERLRLHRGALRSLLPGVFPDASSSEPPTPVHVADALLRLCQSCGRTAPATLVIEDLHWADEESLVAIEYLADQVHGTALALIATLRPDGAAWAVTRRLAARASTELVRLGPLHPDGVRQLAAARLGSDPPGELLDALAVAEGVPLLVEELLATYVQRGLLTEHADGWCFIPGPGIAVPASVEANVSERLSHLDDQDRRIIRAGALLGREFDAALLVLGLAVNAGDVDRALLRAGEIGVLTTGPTAGVMRFSHALVRDAVLFGPPGAEVAETAAPLLGSLRERFDTDAGGGPLDLELGARLAMAAADKSRAGEMFERAGRDALARGLPADAARLLDQALDVLPAGEHALRVREALVQALAAAGEATRTASVGEVVRRQLVASRAGEARLHTCTIAMARAAANAGRWQSADELVRPLVDAGTLPASARALVASIALMLGRFAEVRGVAIGTGYALASLLADDRDLALTQWTEAVASLRTLPAPAPLPPWYLWPLVATVFDLEGDGGARARTETDAGELRVATGPDGVWHLAHAVAAGRAGDTDGAAKAASIAAERFATVPAFAGYIHLAHRLAAESAVTDGWGDPARWLGQASAWAREHDFEALDKACTGLGRRAGVRQHRKGRGDTVVPAHLRDVGVTSREADVLNLVAIGLTNRDIAERLYLSVRTVKGHMENLLAKTGAANRTQLAALAEHPR